MPAGKRGSGKEAGGRVRARADRTHLIEGPVGVVKGKGVLLASVRVCQLWGGRGHESQRQRKTRAVEKRARGLGEERNVCA